jgi:hypothetical protein
MPRIAEKHAKRVMELQQEMSACEVGRTKMFIRAQVPDVVPRSTK